MPTAEDLEGRRAEVNRALSGWQERYNAQPRVWCVIVKGEDTGNLYSTAAAAQLEVDWRNARGSRARVSCFGHLHDERLARERWGETKVAKESPDAQR